MKPKDGRKLAAVIAATCRMAAERELPGPHPEIAKAAGVDTSAVYVDFADKDALFNEVDGDAKRAYELWHFFGYSETFDESP
jgi:TetR/AcrR family transcriptional regulator, repressor of fatR-cypB operon